MGDYGHIGEGLIGLIRSLSFIIAALLLLLIFACVVIAYLTWAF